LFLAYEKKTTKMTTHAKKEKNTTNKHKTSKTKAKHKHQKKIFLISFQYIDPTPYQPLIKPLFRPYRNLF
jgi:hypothetical protein